jgi:hypothetical protein
MKKANPHLDKAKEHLKMAKKHHANAKACMTRHKKAKVKK